MTLSAALHNAFSGLTAASRGTDVVSSNIANATTPGFGRRTLALGSNSEAGGGVRIVGLQRHSNPVLLSSRRDADAHQGAARDRVDFFRRSEGLLGQPGTAGSISSRLAEFETGLISAASRPDSVQRLDSAVLGAKALAQALANASRGVQGMRAEADKSIATQVDRLNQGLEQVQKLNVRLAAIRSPNDETAALLDQRQGLIDDINKMVPVNVIERSRGQIALYSQGGAALLDGRAAVLAFAPVNEVVPEMTLGSGALSGITINGLSVSVDHLSGPLRGGTLGAQFEIRDELGVSAQAGLDAVARDLIEQFETPGLDSTVATGDPGLFTDNGSALDPTMEIGLAGRLSVNALVDGTKGGASWRLRDGIGAPAPGDEGDARLLQALQTVLAEKRAPLSGNFGTGKLDAKGISSALLSGAGQERDLSERTFSYESGRLQELIRAEQSEGVDTDAELQSLMILEQVYAANVRVFEAADEMMKKLLGI